MLPSSVVWVVSPWSVVVACQRFTSQLFLLLSGVLKDVAVVRSSVREALSTVYKGPNLEHANPRHAV